MWLEFSAGITERIEEAERGNVPLQFYNLKAGCYQGIHTCEGDMYVICNALADYADLLMEFIKQSNYEGYQMAFYELHAERCRKISLKLQEQMGYNRLEAMERCRKKGKYYGGENESNSDVGEEAMVLMVKRNREKEKAKKEGENHDRENIRGNSDDGGPERAGEQFEKS